MFSLAPLLILNRLAIHGKSGVTFPSYAVDQGFGRLSLQEHKKSSSKASFAKKKVTTN